MLDEALLPTQPAPPQFALSELLPHEVSGVTAWAFPVVAASAAEESPLLLGPGADEAGEVLGIDLLEAVESLGVSGKVGEVAAIPVVASASSGQAGDGPRLVYLVGVGSGTLTEVRRAAADLARATRGRTESLATTLNALLGEEGVEAVVTGMMLGSFAFRWRSQPAEELVSQVVLADVVADDPAEVLTRAITVAGAGWQSRFLSTVPANVKNPAWLAQQAEQIADAAGLDIRVWDEQQLAKDGFGGILAVGGASASPARLVQLDYRPAKATRKTPHVVLVGKGITFDTGGLNIKPGDSMSTMKRDMTGAAAVLSVMGALRDLGVPVQVTGLLPIAENAISGSAMRPGDVITHFGGRTSEVTNTDAEGRLVMADALAYAVAELKPSVLVDIATLTGAMKVALGLETAGFFAKSDSLAAALFAAGERSGEPIWRMPLASEYEDKLASKVADADNAAGGAGAITAALFLQHFTGSVPWAHLDIAPVGDTVADRHEWTAGPSGFGSRLLLRWLMDGAPA